MGQKNQARLASEVQNGVRRTDPLQGGQVTGLQVEKANYMSTLGRVTEGSRLLMHYAQLSGSGHWSQWVPHREVCQQHSHAMA